MEARQDGTAGGGVSAGGVSAGVRLEPDECRVLGVLIEKAQTTPGQYPLTLNALVAGCNQLSNREPVVTLNEERVLDGLDGLKRKGLARELMLENSRVAKFRHMGRDVLAVSTEELVLLAELLLRGPQSAGSLRQNASRMAAIATLEACQGLLEGLTHEQATPTGVRPAMVRVIPPSPGTRAVMYGQVLCPDLHGPVAVREGGRTESREGAGEEPGYAGRVAALEAEMVVVKAALQRLAARVGEGDPFVG
ncbi:MAG: DUF480 domain-containing protein [Phycisphaerales bacterium]